jgi:G3E family GTPase
MADKVPVTILTGFLGSGKTTLLNHILTQQHGKKIAVIENEFGDVGIDDDLLLSNVKEHTGEDVIEMMNGCICCTVRQDLVEVIKKLAKRKGPPLDGIVIETTGLADPAPVAQTFFVDEEVEAFTKLDGIITLVDAKHVEQHLDEVKPEGVENEAVEQVAFADRILLNKCDLVPEEADLERVEKRLKEINKFAPIIRSTKSEVSVEQILNIGAFDLNRVTEMEPDFLADEGHEHEHDTTVSSLGFDLPGDVDLGLLQDWLGVMLREKGTELYRMKGVLSIEGEEKKYVYHAVHMVFNGTFTDDWGAGEERCCRLTFIGKNLDHDEIREKFYACMCTEENMDKRRAALRFQVGDLVECRTGPAEWSAGTVVQQLWKSPSGQVAPYQIELEGSGTLIFAPADDNQLIRARASARP